jgi:very-short-patch-repair endonuclease
VYLRYRVLVEYDGEQHRTDEAQFARDVDRLDGVMAEGWRVIRVLKDTPDAEVVARVDRALRSRGWRPGIRPA